MKMIVGRMAKGNEEITHLGKYVKTVSDPDGGQYRLYEPFCSRMNSRSVAYLAKTTRTDITCKRCAAKVQQRWELVPLQ